MDKFFADWVETVKFKGLENLVLYGMCMSAYYIMVSSEVVGGPSAALTSQILPAAAAAITTQLLPGEEGAVAESAVRQREEWTL